MSLLRVKPRTIAGYDQMWRTHIQPRFGSWPISAVRFSDISGWVAELSVTKSPATTRKAHRVLSLLLGWGVTAGLVAHNEAAGVKLPRVEKHRAVAADVNTIETLASAVSPSARDLVHLLTYTGLRWGEAAALQAGDVDLTRRRIHVVRTFVELGGTLTTGTPKTNRTRHVPITAPLVPMLERRIENLPRTGLVFTGPNGGPWRNSNFRRDSNWDEATRYAGIDDVADRLATTIQTGCGHNAAIQPFEAPSDVARRGRN